MVAVDSRVDALDSKTLEGCRTSGEEPESDAVFEQ